MDELSTIRSPANPAWKRVRRALAGKDARAMALEGDRLIEDAHRAGVPVEAVFVDEERTELVRRWSAAGLPVRTVGSSLLRQASGLVTPPGSVALAARPPARRVAEVELSGSALVLVAAGVADPGNLGALARSAEAAGAELLVVLAGSAGPWTPKALRGSMGSLLRLPVADRASAGETFAALEDMGFRQVRADARAATAFDELDWSGRVALWVAGETGVLDRAPETTRAARAARARADDRGARAPGPDRATDTTRVTRAERPERPSPAETASRSPRAEREAREPEARAGEATGALRAPLAAERGAPGNTGDAGGTSAAGDAEDAEHGTDAEAARDGEEAGNAESARAVARGCTGVRIPMRGAVESLNAAAAATVLLFAAGRYREPRP